VLSKEAGQQAVNLFTKLMSFSRQKFLKILMSFQKRPHHILQFTQ
jgi:hypothetical protein